MIKFEDINNLKTARQFVMYYSRFVEEEGVIDTFGRSYLSIEQFADALVKYGVITQKLADEYVRKFDKIDLAPSMFDYEPSKQVAFLTNNVDFDVDNEGDDYYGLFYAVLFLEDKAFAHWYWCNFIDTISEDGLDAEFWDSEEYPEIPEDSEQFDEDLWEEAGFILADIQLPFGD